MRFVLIGLVLLIALAVVAATYGSLRWHRGTLQLVSRIEANAQVPSVQAYDEQEITNLPAVVQRYFRKVLVPGQKIITAVQVAHKGTFNMSETGEQWLPFSSNQTVVTQPAAFLWNGKIQMFPGISAHVHDAYIEGNGLLRVSLLGLVTIAEISGKDKIAQGELMRFFAEAAWYPTRLLPSQGVHWAAVDEYSAKATMTSDDLTLTMLFTFNEDDLIATVSAEARGRTVGNNMVFAPWEGRWSNYQRRDGMLIPMHGEAVWLLPEGDHSYWRGDITSITFDYADKNLL